MDDLPDELLLRILDLLPDYYLIHCVPCVCLRWSSLSLDSQIWKNRTYYVGWHDSSAAVKFFSRKPALRSVCIFKLENEAVHRSLASHCPTITSLSLLGQQPLSLETLRLITSNCDQIRNLCVSSEVLSCPVSSREVALMPRLETLYVEDDLYLGGQALQLRELGAGCASLQHLDLGKAKNFRLGDLGASLLGRLQRLSIRLDAMSPDIVHCAESLEKLTLHCILNSSRPSSALGEDLLSLKSLTHVEVMSCNRDPQVLRALTPPLLRSLKLSFCRILNNNLLLELCHRCPLLEDLNIAHCSFITARGLRSMWSLRRLRRLCLNGCTRLESGAMRHLARCDVLQELRMQCMDIGRKKPGVSQLLELKNLRVLEFEAWSVRELIPWEEFPKAFPQLTTLDLGGWKSQDTYILKSLKAAMPMTQVKWYKLLG